MSDDEMIDGEFEEELDEDLEIDPDDIDEEIDVLEADIDVDLVIDDAVDEVVDPSTSMRRPTSEDDDDDDDLTTPDDVEADLDAILKDRMVAAEETPIEDDEEDEVDDRSESSDRLQPKRPDERLCTSCFLLVRESAPQCPVGDDACPLFPA